jgi:UMF1 family MFS transporter
MFFDWATQPIHTLIVAFIFAPYFTSFVASSPEAGAAQIGYATAAAGLILALSAPVMGAIADAIGPRKPWIFLFTGVSVLGAASLWWATPGMESTLPILIGFAACLIGVEFAIVFNNAMLPDLAPKGRIGSVSGYGWAFGYAGGLVVLILTLLLFAESESGTTILGIEPIFGLDPSEREGTRAVGPITALWIAIFLIPFMLWSPDVAKRGNVKGAVGRALRDLLGTLRTLPKTPSLLNYLLSSMFYRDALFGLFSFGAIYAGNALGWSTTQIGIFGILTLVTGMAGSWIGGEFDSKLGPKPVITVCVVTLILVCLMVVMTTRTSVLGIPVSETSILPDVVFYLAGGIIGATAGPLLSSSRTLLVHQANPERITEAFGLFALTGKATAFVAPFTIGLIIDLTGSLRLGIIPLVALFVIGLILLTLVD